MRRKRRNPRGDLKQLAKIAGIGVLGVYGYKAYQKRQKHIAGKPLGWPSLLVAAGVYELLYQVPEFEDRHAAWNAARQYCQRVGKPLLRIGVRRSPLEPPNGDATLDIDPAILTIRGGVLGDERSMPFRDRQFGVAFNEHTLEHLATPQDVEAAVSECLRVADFAVFLFPSPGGIVAKVHPTHHLLLRAVPGGLKVWPIGQNEATAQTIRLPNAQSYGRDSMVIASRYNAAAWG